MPADNLPILAGIQPTEFRRKGAILPLARRAMEPGHLLHSVTGWECTASPIETPIYPPYNNSSAHLKTTTEVRCFGWIIDEWGVVGEQNKTLYFFPRHRYPPSRNSPWACQEQRGSGLTASAPLSDVFVPAYKNVAWPLLRLVSVAQRHRQLTMLSFTVQSIDLPVECMAWRFWMTRKPNGCSTPAPRSTAA